MVFLAASSGVYVHTAPHTGAEGSKTHQIQSKRNDYSVALGGFCTAQPLARVWASNWAATE